MMTETAEEKMAERERSKPHARAFWSGTVSFGLVSIPVHLFPATRGGRAALRLLDRDGTPVRRRYYCPAHERDVHPEHILRGYPADGAYVTVSEEELESVEPRKSRDIDLRKFVDKSQVPPALFEKGYFLVPAGDSAKAYRLLADAMERTRRAGIATFVMRGKEYLIVILAERGILLAETLRFQDELRQPDDVGLPEKEKPPTATVSLFVQEIKKLTKKQLDEDEMADEYSERLRALANEQVQAGQGLVELDEYEPDENDDTDEEDEGLDLLETIRQSLHVADRRTKPRAKKKKRQTARRGKSTKGATRRRTRAR